MAISRRASRHPLRIRMRPLQYHGKYHGGAVVAVNTSPNDAALSALGSHIDDLDVAGHLGDVRRAGASRPPLRAGLGGHYRCSATPRA